MQNLMVNGKPDEIMVQSATNEGGPMGSMDLVFRTVVSKNYHRGTAFVIREDVEKKGRGGDCVGQQGGDGILAFVVGVRRSFLSRTEGIQEKGGGEKRLIVSKIVL